VGRLFLDCAIQKRSDVLELSEKPTLQAYEELQRAFDFFNEELFASGLPPCLITLQRKHNTCGYYHPERFVSADGEKVDEIALNPEFFALNPIEITLSVLVHEMVHAQTYHSNTAGRRGYHNKSWANIMETIGLIPSSTGKPGGDRTGEAMDHYIEPNGLFDRACKELLTESFRLSWYDRLPSPEQVAKLREKISESAQSVASPPVATHQEIEADWPSCSGAESGSPTESQDDTAEAPSPPPYLQQPREDSGPSQAKFTEEILENARAMGVEVDREPPAKNKSNRSKYKCPNCDLSVWGKPGVKVLCGECSDTKNLVVLIEGERKGE
jgi:predicted SprT family Zn-dependent metalloprotease